MDNAPVANLRAHRVSTALAAMSSPLRAKYVAIGEHLGRTRRRSLLARYDVGVLVQEIMADEVVYGPRAVALVCDALGLKKTALYDAASVARRWTRAAFQELAEQPTIHRVALSFSHFVAVAELAEASRRDALLADARSGGLSVRELRRLVQCEEQTVPQRRASSTLRSSARLASALTRSSASLRASFATLSDDAEHTALLAVTADAYRALRSEIEATLVLLDEAAASAGRAAGASGKVSGALWGVVRAKLTAAR